MLANHSTYSYRNVTFIVGEVQNTTARPADDVRVTANFVDAGGRVIGTEFAFLYLDSIAAKDKACFAISFIDGPPSSRYTFEVAYDQEHVWPEARLTIVENTGRAVRGTDNAYSYRITGRIRNDDSRRATVSRVVATVYRGQTVLGCARAFGSSTDLEPGQITTFDAEFSSIYRNWTDVSSYRLQATGRLP